MKLTWFGGTAFRIHIGGQVMVIDPERAVGSVERAELVSGADHVLGLEDARQVADPVRWKVRARESLLKAGEQTRPVETWSMGPGALLIEADEDMPLLVLVGDIPEFGRWVERSVVMLTGTDLARRAGALANASSPRLVALAGPAEEIDAAFAAVRDNLDGTGLVALEPGLAVEV